jgi:hypothetical protein
VFDLEREINGFSAEDRIGTRHNERDITPALFTVKDKRMTGETAPPVQSTQGRRGWIEVVAGWAEVGLHHHPPSMSPRRSRIRWRLRVRSRRREVGLGWAETERAMLICPDA